MPDVFDQIAPTAQGDIFDRVAAPAAAKAPSKPAKAPTGDIFDQVAPDHIGDTTEMVAQPSPDPFKLPATSPGLMVKPDSSPSKFALPPSASDDLSDIGTVAGEQFSRQGSSLKEQAIARRPLMSQRSPQKQAQADAIAKGLSEQTGRPVDVLATQEQKNAVLGKMQGERDASRQREAAATEQIAVPGGQFIARNLVPLGGPVVASMAGGVAGVGAVVAQGEAGSYDENLARLHQLRPDLTPQELSDAVRGTSAAVGGVEGLIAAAPGGRALSRGASPYIVSAAKGAGFNLAHKTGASVATGAPLPSAQDALEGATAGVLFHAVGEGIHALKGMFGEKVPQEHLNRIIAAKSPEEVARVVEEARAGTQRPSRQGPSVAPTQYQQNPGSVESSQNSRPSAPPTTPTQPTREVQIQAASQTSQGQSSQPSPQSLPQQTQPPPAAQEGTRTQESNAGAVETPTTPDTAQPPVARPGAKRNPLKIVEEWGDAVGRGEYAQRLVARDETGREVGRVEVNYVQSEPGTAYVRWVEVPKEMRRQGIATEMYDWIKQNQDVKEIKRFGDVGTPEGTSFRQAYEKRADSLPPQPPAGPPSSGAAVAISRAQGEAKQTPAKAGALFSENSAERATRIIDPKSRLGVNEEVWASNDRDLAAGQGENRGVTIEFDPAKVKTVERGEKPGAALVETQGKKEYSVLGQSPELSSAVRSVTIDPKLTTGPFAGRLKNILNREGFEPTKNADGTLTYRKPAADEPVPIVSDAEKAGLLGEPPAKEPPAPAKVEAPQSEPVTSARKAMMAQDRESLGLDKLNSPDRRSWQEALDKARTQGIPDRAMRLAAEAKETGRAFSDVETAGVVQHAAQLKNEHAAVMDEIGKLTDPGEIKLKAAEAMRIEQDFDALSEALKLSGTEKGRALAAQKLTINKDYRLISVLNRAKAMKGGDLKPAERAKFETMTKQLEEHSNRITQLETKLADRHVNEALRESRAKKYSRMTPEERAAELGTKYEKLRGLLKAGCNN